MFSPPCIISWIVSSIILNPNIISSSLTAAKLILILLELLFL